MSKLLAIVDEYKDTHGAPSDSSIARAIDISPQTLSSWRTRGIKNMPEADTLKRMADFFGVPHEEYVVQAALFDAGYRTTMPTLEEARNRQTARARQAGLDERGHG